MGNVIDMNAAREKKQQEQAQQAPAKKNQIAIMAERLNVDPEEMQGMLMQTVMPNKGQRVSNEEFVTFLAIANKYSLDPLAKEIYAFPNRGGVQPIVSIDGWLRIINSQPNLDGITYQDQFHEGKLVAVTCEIHLKDRSYPTSITEYMEECQGTSEPWKKYPARMLRHKATIQAGRYAFGLSGIIDPDEAERIQDIEKTVSPVAKKTKSDRLNSLLAEAEEAPAEVVDTATGEVFVNAVEQAREHIEAMQACTNEDCLKKTYGAAYRWAKVEAPEQLEALELIKDQCRADLQAVAS